MSFALLRILGEAVAAAVGGGIAGKAPCELLPDIARGAWAAWSGQKDGEQRRAEIEALVRIEEGLFRLPMKDWDAAEKPLSDALAQIIQAVAADRPAAFQKFLRDYLREVPRAVRHRSRWPKGTSGVAADAAAVEETGLPRDAGDLLAWLPNWLPLLPADLTLSPDAWLSTDPPNAHSTEETLMLDLDTDVTLELVRIPAGEFLMGSPESETGREPSETQHPVQISRPFYMGKYEITQRQWKTVMRVNPSAFHGDERPVDNLFWFDCLEFCRRLGQKTGLRVRLPTEAEWEYACRAGTTTPFYAGQEIRTEDANFDGTFYDDPEGLGGQREETIPVGRCEPNAWGLCDLYGNVAEWCADWLGEYPAGAQTDPTGPAGGVYRVVRGGSWRDKLWTCRSAARGGSRPNFRQMTYGFRIVIQSI